MATRITNSLRRNTLQPGDDCVPSTASPLSVLQPVSQTRDSAERASPVIRFDKMTVRPRDSIL
jgi:hypothetical protein